MTRDEAITVLLNVAWLGTNEERERTEDAVGMAIEALKQETRTDAISRQAALKLFATNDGKYLYEAIRDLPSVTPNQRTGHWIEVAEYSDGKHKIKCSECESHIFDRGHANSYVVKEKYKYCPRCGAKMESEEQA